MTQITPSVLQDLAIENEEEEKIVNLELVFGYHLKSANSPEVNVYNDKSLYTV